MICLRAIHNRLEDALVLKVQLGLDFLQLSLGFTLGEVGEVIVLRSYF